MRIPYFSKFVDKYTINDQPLNGSTLVFDGNKNYFFSLYKTSRLHYIFGCESDKYLDYLKQQLSIYKIANVKCYFLFIGCSKSENFDFEKIRTCDPECQPHQKEITLPIFMWQIHKQALEEMGLSYTFCLNVYEMKRECIALAQKLQCPIVSYDIEFCMSGVPYIPRLTIKFNENTETLTANIFSLDNFLSELGIDEDKLATFVVLMDENVFPPNHFRETLKYFKLRDPKLKKYWCLLSGLAGMNTERAIRVICAGISPEDQEKFLEAKNRVRNMIRRQETPGIPSEYLINGCRIEITENDPAWFEKGFISGKIAFPYADLYRNSMTWGSFAIANDDAEEPLLLSSEIIKYAYSLLTNFQKETFTIKPCHREDIVVEATGIVQPEYEARESVFENGWDRIQSLRLLEHFLMQTIPGLQDVNLDEVPDDAKLLMIALCYFKRYSSDDNTDALIGSLILSYVSLGVVNETQSNDTDQNKAAITDTDKEKVKQLLLEYTSPLEHSVARQIFKRTLLHPFVQFQHCLDHLGFLNKLCGSPYRPIVFSKTIRGTFIYRILYTMVREGTGDPFGFITQMLNSAPTVLAFVERLLNIFREVV